jgi:hypothetical protein
MTGRLLEAHISRYAQGTTGPNQGWNGATILLDHMAPFNYCSRRLLHCHVLPQLACGLLPVRLLTWAVQEHEAEQPHDRPAELEVPRRAHVRERVEPARAQREQAGLDRERDDGARLH